MAYRPLLKNPIMQLARKRDYRWANSRGIVRLRADCPVEFGEGLSLDTASLVGSDYWSDPGGSSSMELAREDESPNPFPGTWTQLRFTRISPT